MAVQQNLHHAANERHSKLESSRTIVKCRLYRGRHFMPARRLRWGWEDPSELRKHLVRYDLPHLCNRADCIRDQKGICRCE